MAEFEQRVPVLESNDCGQAVLRWRDPVEVSEAVASGEEFTSPYKPWSEMSAEEQAELLAEIEHDDAEGNPFGMGPAVDYESPGDF